MSPIFQSEEEAVKAHEHYHLDTDREGKFHSQHTGWLRTKQLLEWVPEGGKVILGVGCNSGGLEKTILQRKKGNIVYGVDVNKDLVALAIRKGVIAKVAKGEDLPFKNEFFDVVILSEVLEHVFDMDNFINESLRVLKKGGLLLGSVPHPKGGNAMKGVENHLYHTRIFTKQSLKKALVQLSNLEIKEIGFNAPDLPDFKIDRTPQWMAWRGYK